MARATRSSVQQDKPSLKHPDSKKRKRTSDSADEPAQKLQRTETTPYAAALPIDPDHAHKIIHVLQMIDSQGLLDRVYPLEQSTRTYSLRNLLENSQEHTLSTLRTAVENLEPISIHPRAAAPAPAAQQQRFCDVALSLLEQASFHPVSLEVESFLPQDPGDDDEPSKPVATSNKRYALMQHLPSGDYWTSANLPLSTAPETGPADLKDVPTGHADLVAIFPAPSAASTSALPKLASYNRQPAPSYDPPRQKYPPAKRRVTCGSFLDYGPWASFAPSWDQNGREIGKMEVGEVYAQKAQRYRETLQARQRTMELQQSVAEPPPLPSPEAPEPPDVEALQDILAPDEIESLKSVLGSLELENAVQELLNRNRKALQRLGQLQVERLRAEGGRTSSVKEGDEEWDVAHGILDSLTLLASLRPRSSAHPAAPLCPPPAVLHTLMNTLPRAAVHGWHGTLPGRLPALRDDTTVKVRPGVPAVAPTPVPATPVPGPTPTYAPYGTYYTPQTAPRAAPAVAGQYRYNSRAPQPVQGQGQGQQYYAQGYAGGSNQLPYGYTATAGWYGSYGAGAGGSAVGTPTAAAGTGTGSYGSFFTTGSGTSTPVAGGKAVANTVLGKAGAGQWGAQTPPVLPPHLRTMGSQYTPS
ncbi:hypothetical protein B0H11DRAFT_1808616 [Mycena galericulata]|nr:hypothetical protein B0H11DRAFT_1808616 [Mycena galericulata]